MKFKCLKPVMTPTNEPVFYGDGKLVTARNVALDALNVRLPIDTQGMRAKRSRDLYTLGLKIAAADEVELTVPELQVIATRIGHHPEHAHFVIGWMLEYTDEVIAGTHHDAVKADQPSVRVVTP